MENDDSILSEFIPEETVVSFFQGFLTRAVDFCIEIALLFVLYMVLPESLLVTSPDWESLVRTIFVVVVVVTYQLSFLFLFGKTPGMMVCRVKYLNRDLRPLSVKEKLLSMVRGRYSGIRFYKDK